MPVMVRILPCLNSVLTRVRVSELCNLELYDVSTSQRNGRVVVRRKANKYMEVVL